VSVVGFIFGLLLHHAPTSAVAIGGLGGAISATVSMTTGELEKSETRWRDRLDVGLAMGASTLVGSMLPVLPFFWFSRTTAVLIAIGLCIVVGTWIGIERRQGLVGFVKTYLILAGAVGLTLAVVSAIPASA
jgi:predicted membrane protein (TIGR00267 family)